MAVYTAYPELICTACGAMFRPLPGTAQKMFPEVVERESANCMRIRELAAREQELAFRIRAGIAGIGSAGGIDTVDLFAHRLSLARLSIAVKKEREQLAQIMLHVSAA